MASDSDLDIKTSCGFNVLKRKLKQQLQADIKRAYLESLFSDIQIIFKNEEIRLHRCILKSRAPLLYGILFEDSRDCYVITSERVQDFIREIYIDAGIREREEELVKHIIETEKYNNLWHLFYRSGYTRVGTSSFDIPTNGAFSDNVYRGINNLYYSLVHLDEACNLSDTSSDIHEQEIFDPDQAIKLSNCVPKTKRKSPYHPDFCPHSEQHKDIFDHHKFNIHGYCRYEPFLMNHLEPVFYNNVDSARENTELCSSFYKIPKMDCASEELDLCKKDCSVTDANNESCEDSGLGIKSSENVVTTNGSDVKSSSTLIGLSDSEATELVSIEETLYDYDSSLILSEYDKNSEIMSENILEKNLDMHAMNLSRSNGNALHTESVSQAINENSGLDHYFHNWDTLGTSKTSVGKGNYFIDASSLLDDNEPCCFSDYTFNGPLGNNMPNVMNKQSENFQKTSDLHEYISVESQKTNVIGQQVVTNVPLDDRNRLLCEDGGQAPDLLNGNSADYIFSTNKTNAHFIDAKKFSKSPVTNDAALLIHNISHTDVTITPDVNLTQGVTSSSLSSPTLLLTDSGDAISAGQVFSHVDLSLQKRTNSEFGMLTNNILHKSSLSTSALHELDPLNTRVETSNIKENSNVGFFVKLGEPSCEERCSINTVSTKSVNKNDGESEVSSKPLFSMFVDINTISNKGITNISTTKFVGKNKSIEKKECSSIVDDMLVISSDIKISPADEKYELHKCEGNTNTGLVCTQNQMQNMNKDNCFSMLIKSNDDKVIGDKDLEKTKRNSWCSEECVSAEGENCWRRRSNSLSSNNDACSVIRDSKKEINANKYSLCSFNQDFPVDIKERNISLINNGTFGIKEVSKDNLTVENTNLSVECDTNEVGKGFKFVDLSKSFSDNNGNSQNYENNENNKNNSILNLIGSNDNTVFLSKDSRNVHQRNDSLVLTGSCFMNNVSDNICNVTNDKTESELKRCFINIEVQNDVENSPLNCSPNFEIVKNKEQSVTVVDIQTSSNSYPCLSNNDPCTNTKTNCFIDASSLFDENDINQTSISLPNISYDTDSLSNDKEHPRDGNNTSILHTNEKSAVESKLVEKNLDLKLDKNKCVIKNSFGSVFQDTNMLSARENADNESDQTPDSLNNDAIEFDILNFQQYSGKKCKDDVVVENIAARSDINQVYSKLGDDIIGTNITRKKSLSSSESWTVGFDIDNCKLPSQNKAMDDRSCIPCHKKSPNTVVHSGTLDVQTISGDKELDPKSSMELSEETNNMSKQDFLLSRDKNSIQNKSYKFFIDLNDSVECAANNDKEVEPVAPSKQLFSMFIDFGTSTDSDRSNSSFSSKSLKAKVERRRKPQLPTDRFLKSQNSDSKFKSKQSSQDDSSVCLEQLEIRSNIATPPPTRIFTGTENSSTDLREMNKKNNLPMFDKNVGSQEANNIVRRKNLPSGLQPPSQRNSWNMDKSISVEDIENHRVRSCSISLDDNVLTDIASVERKQEREKCVTSAMELQEAKLYNAVSSHGTSCKIETFSHGSPIASKDDVFSQNEGLSAFDTVIINKEMEENISNVKENEAMLGHSSNQSASEQANDTKIASNMFFNTLHSGMNSSQLQLRNNVEKGTTVSAYETSFVKLSDMDRELPRTTGDEKRFILNRMCKSIPETNWLENKLLSGSANSRSLSRIFPHLSASVLSKTSSDMEDTTASTISSMRSSMEPSACGSVEEVAVDNDMSLNTLGQDLLRMFLDEISPDVVVEVSGRRIKAHKCILSSRCQYFAAMLSGGWVESAGNVISLHGFSYGVVHFALCHIYSGESNIPDSINIAELATLADMLCLEGLKEVISYTLKSKYCHFFHKPCSICSVGVLECLPLAAAYGLDDIYRKSLLWLAKYYVRLWPLKSFAMLPREIIDKCYKQHTISMTIDNVLEILMNCDKLLSIIPRSRWAEPSVSITNRLHDYGIKFIAQHFIEFIGSESFNSLAVNRSWAIVPMVEKMWIICEKMSMDQICLGYSIVHQSLKVASTPKLSYNTELVDLLSKVKEQIERNLIKQAAKASQCSAWYEMESELRHKIQTSAGLIFLPDENKRARNLSAMRRSNGPGTRSRSLITQHTRAPTHRQSTSLAQKVQQHQNAGASSSSVPSRQRESTVDSILSSTSNKSRLTSKLSDVKPRYLEQKRTPTERTPTEKVTAISVNKKLPGIKSKVSKVSVTSSESSQITSPAMKHSGSAHRYAATGNDRSVTSGSHSATEIRRNSRPKNLSQKPTDANVNNNKTNQSVNISAAVPAVSNKESRLQSTKRNNQSKLANSQSPSLSSSKFNSQTNAKVVGVISTAMPKASNEKGNCHFGQNPVKVVNQKPTPALSKVKVGLSARKSVNIPVNGKQLSVQKSINSKSNTPKKQRSVPSSGTDSATADIVNTSNVCKIVPLSRSGTFCKDEPTLLKKPTEAAVIE